MKILFVDSVEEAGLSSRPLASWSKMQFGISYISSMLKASGYDTELLVLRNNKYKESLRLVRSCMEKTNPDIVGFTAVFSQYAFIDKMACFMRENWPGKFYVMGGVHATLNPEDVIKGPFDAMCVGEGEYPMAELCRRLEKGQEPRGIANFWFKSRSGEISSSAPRDFIRDLDSLPFPDRGMWKPWMAEDPEGEQVVLVGRGCPYNCTYCCNHAIRRIAGGKYVRMRSPENIIREIEAVYNDYPHRKVLLEAESIALDKRWAFDFCDKLSSFNASIGNAISYSCNFRVSRQSLDEDLFMAFEKANFYKIYIGLESGSERVRREVLKRDYSNDDFVNAVSLAHKHGLLVSVYNLIGIPGESMSDHMETVLINHLCQPDDLCTSIFFPYPGTELYNACIRQGLIKKDSVSTEKERRQAVLDLPGFSSAQIQKAYRLFEGRVYRGRFPWWKKMLRAAREMMPAGARSAISRAMDRLPAARRLHDSLKGGPSRRAGK